ncbi:helix-turn-helix domain-containing protein [Terribacillus sp. 7520-G]|uniref:helix-turn-helix domain-containing protein n=1 Tax=Terribacillus TaxID=459532 RepID=UPI000BA64D83|nr:helix-turn-helix transcriptional regulator [Terribacillus sp. 7520-G]PAD38647.1 hypothetical protein CHH53_10485 [Terribacillus sp. 7520-G]
MSFGNRLKKARERMGLSQKFAAEKLGIKNNTLSSYESDVRQPDLDMLKKISDLYEVSVDYLVNGDNTSSREVAEKAYNDPDFQYAMRSLHGMNQESKEEVLNFIEYIMQRQKGRKPGQRQPNPPRFNKD